MGRMALHLVDITIKNYLLVVMTCATPNFTKIKTKTMSKNIYNFSHPAKVAPIIKK